MMLGHLSHPVALSGLPTENAQVLFNGGFESGGDPVNLNIPYGWTNSSSSGSRLVANTSYYIVSPIFGDGSSMSGGTPRTGTYCITAGYIPSGGYAEITQEFGASGYSHVQFGAYIIVVNDDSFTDTFAVFLDGRNSTGEAWTTWYTSSTSATTTVVDGAWTNLGYSGSFGFTFGRIRLRVTKDRDQNRAAHGAFDDVFVRLYNP
jgi:hypothetical protein